jgi:hypothetical protein
MHAAAATRSRAAVVPDTRLASTDTVHDGGPASVEVFLIITARCVVVLDSGSNSEYLKCPRGRPTKENDRENDNDEHHRTQRRLCIASFETSREGNPDHAAETHPKKHHLVGMGKALRCADHARGAGRN